MTQHLQENTNAHNYEHITNIENAFINGNIGTLPDTLVVEGIVYRYLESTEYPWDEILKNKRKAVMVYSVHSNKENMEKYNAQKADTAEDINHPQRLLVLLWSATRSLSVVPAAARFTTRARQMQAGARGITKEGVEIKYEEQIIINNINNNQPIPCKIDTGADMCSLHAEQIQVNGDSVSFIINNKQYSMPISGSQTVKQADSQQEERPTVMFDFQLGGQTISGVECNLNDRSGMSPMLVGKNLLSKGDFTINTLIDEQLTSEDWSHIETIFEDVKSNEPELIDVTADEIDRVTKFMLERSKLVPNTNNQVE